MDDVASAIRAVAEAMREVGALEVVLTTGPVASLKLGERPALPWADVAPVEALTPEEMKAREEAILYGSSGG